MAGAPIKHERNRAFKEALLAGRTPDEFFKPIAEKLESMAKGGDLASIKEVVDRIDGKVMQEITVERTDTTIDASLLGNMSELLRLVQPKKEREVVGGTDDAAKQS